MLVGRLAHADLAAAGLNGLSIDGEGLRDLELNPTTDFSEVLENGLKMFLTLTANDVEAAGVNVTLDEGIHFGEALEAFDLRSSLERKASEERKKKDQQEQGERKKKNARGEGTNHVGEVGSVRRLYRHSHDG